MNNQMGEITRRTDSYELVLGFGSSRPTVVFALKEPMAKGHRAVFCRVFRYTGMVRDLTVEFAEKEVYGILVFTDLKVSLEKGICYAVLSLASFTPLVEAQQLDEITWAIRLTESILKGGTLTLPVRRQSIEKMSSGSIGLLHIFHGSSELFCKQGITGIEVGGPLMGCIEPRPRVENLAHDWVVMLAARLRKDPVKAKPKKFGSFRIQLFDIQNINPMPFKLDIVPTKHVIGNETAYIVVLKNLVKVFRENRRSIYFKAVHATGVDVTCDDGHRWSLPMTDADGPVFGDIMQCSGNIQAAATVPTNSEVPFRLFNISVENPTLFEFPSDTDGLIQINDTNVQFALGFQQQVMWNLRNGKVYKTWWGTYKTTPLNTPGTVTVKLISKPGWWELQVWFKGPQQEEVMINWGIQKYVHDPAGFFDRLGIKRAKDNYTLEETDFAPNGAIVVKENGIDLVALQNLAIVDFLDLKPEHVRTFYIFSKTNDGGRTFVPMEDDFPEAKEVSLGLDEDSLLMIEVALGAFVGALIISLVGMIIYKRRWKTKAKSSSTVSHQSSPDEVRQEGLMETIE
jgi:hypothetical protein